MAYTWEELAGLTLARQFPAVEGRNPDSVHEVLHRIGPIQTQTARSAFTALAARMPGVTHRTISTAYDDLLIVRGSSLRGTVHTSTAADHPLLEVATRLGQRALWARTLRLERATPEDVWAGIEDFAWSQWRTPAELSEHLLAWLAEHDPGAAARLGGDVSRFFGFGHGGLLRRPLRGGWESQGAPGYRAAAALLGDRSAALADPEASMDALVRRHLAAHGPASRNDLAWWSGVGLRTMDASLARISAELTSSPGPDGRDHHDLAGAPAAGAPAAAAPGVRLLPEFDALLCAYDPAARVRFVDEEHYRALWFPANGMLRSSLMVDGRLTGHWRLVGGGRRRSCEIRCFPGTRRPTRAEVDEQVEALAVALGTGIESLTVVRE